MKTKTSFNKSKSQIQLERILNFINENELTVSQFQTLPEYANLNQKLKDSLADVINSLVHEEKTNKLITSLAHSENSRFDEERKEYDTLYKVISETYLGLYSVIKKSSNKGRIRIDTFLDKGPEYFVCELRAYIRNNIVLDTAKRDANRKKHIDPDPFFIDDEGNSCNKIDSVIYNKHNIADSNNCIEEIIKKLSFEHDLCLSLIKAVITRFIPRKPVAAYIYLSIINETYVPMTVVKNLKTRNFNELFHSILHELEVNYNIDLDLYDDIVFTANEYISSFCKIDNRQARARIDRLASQTRTDIKKIPEYKAIRSTYVSDNGKYFSL